MPMKDSEKTAFRILNRMLQEGISENIAYQQTIGSASHDTLSAMTMVDRLDWFDQRQKELQRDNHNPDALTTPTFDKTSTTAVFFDIDGCVSPDPQQNPYRYNFSEPYLFVQPMIPVRLSVINWFKTYHPTRLLWSSSWCSAALTLTEDLGGGPVETVIDERNRLSKPESVTAYLQKNPDITKIAIVEDHPYTLDSPEMASKNILYLTCESHTGLTDKHLTVLDDFIGA